MKQENIITEKVTIIGLVALDFKSDDGKKICGYQIHYYTNPNEKEVNTIGKKYGKIYLAKDSLDDLDKYKSKSYPAQATIEFEFVSLDKKAKPIRIMI